jgi:ABC-2 type transport system permease protein
MLPLLQIELFKIFKRPRTYISFAGIAAMVLLIQFALKMDGGTYVSFMIRDLEDSLIIDKQLILNGYLICFIILNTLLIQVPLLIALIAGDTVAGEANMGTLRLLLTKPYSRTKILLVKFAATAIYTIALLVWMALLSLFFSMFLFGTSDMLILKSDGGLLIPEGDVLWRYFAAFVYASVALLCVAALAFMLSVFAENSIGPIVGTVTIIIIFTILSNMNVPIFDNSIKPYIFTTYMVGWKGFFYASSNDNNEIIAGSIQNLPSVIRGLVVLSVYTALFVIVSIISFNKKDILS